MIVTSPLKRAKQTAETIEHHVNTMMMYEMNDLRERDYGDASGLTKLEVAERYAGGDVPGRENRDNLTRRSMAVLDGMIQHHSGKNIIVVSHGAVINAILALLSGGVIGSGKTVLQNGCINRLTHDGERWEIVVHNSTEHF